jgi:mannose-6-phosphate isomerase-like protein (cupin superfamily)
VFKKTGSLILLVALTIATICPAGAFQDLGVTRQLVPLIDAPGQVTELIAWSDVEQLGFEEASIMVERVVLGAFAATSLSLAAGPELIVVEDGSVVVVDDTQGETLVSAGEFYPVAAGALIGVRNDEFEDATMLHLTVEPVLPNAEQTPPGGLRQALASRRAAAPIRFSHALAQPPTLVEFRIGIKLVGLPSGSVAVFLARSTLEPGDVAIEPSPGTYLTLDGPVSFYASNGAIRLFVQDRFEATASIDLESETCGVVPGGVAFQTRSLSVEPAELIVFGVVSTADKDDAGTGTPVTSEPIRPQPCGGVGA